MALKYWYVASNGSDAWSVAGNWYNGSGGTGGVAGVPTTADDAIVDAASGSGTLTIGGTSTCNSLNTLTFEGTLAGTFALNIVTSSIASNGGFALQLGDNHIYTYSGTITFTTTITSVLYINCNGVFHKGNITFNTATGNWEGWDNIIGQQPIRLTGTLLLTAGSISSSELYAGIISTSNSNVRAFQFYDVYLSGTATILAVTTQTNLSWDVYNIYITSTLNLSKTFSLSNTVCVQGAVYINGSGSASTTATFNVNLINYPYVYVNKLGGTLELGTSTVKSLEFIEGSTITLSTATTLTIIESSLKFCNSMFVTSSGAVTFPIENEAAELYTANKTFSGALTIRGFNGCRIYGNYISTSISANAILISCSSGQAQAVFEDDVQVSGGIVMNSGATGLGNYTTVEFQKSATASSMSIVESLVTLNNLTLVGALSFNSFGSLEFNQNSIVNINSFSSSSSAERQITLNNAIINIAGSTGTIWNTSVGISSGALTFNAGTSTINITDTTGGTVNFLGGGIELYNLNIKRGVMGTNNPITTFTGSQLYRNFRDLTTLQSGFINTIQFASSSNTTILDTFQVGNSGNVTNIISSSLTVYFNLFKSIRGLVICPNVAIRYSAATPSNTWYAISGSVNNVTTGWIFDNIPRRLGSLGAG
jgi:hypothetical protein